MIGSMRQGLVARWTWVVLPRGEAIRRWRREQRWAQVVAVVGLIGSAIAVGLALWNTRAEGSLEHFEARGIAERDGSHAVVEWFDGTTTQTALYYHPEYGFAVGDTIQIVYPIGHPELARAADAPEILVGMVALLVVVVGGCVAGYVFRYKPRAAQLRLAAVGAPRHEGMIEFTTENGRYAVIARDADEETALVVSVGGVDPLPASPQPAVVFGPRAGGSIVLVQLGDALINTIGRVRDVHESSLHGTDE